MWIVNQNSNKILKYIRKLTDDEKRLIHATNSIKIIKKDGSNSKFNEALNFLLHLKQREAWITCDCRKTDPSIMSVCQRDNVIYLRRTTTSPEHEKNCPFYTETILNEYTFTKRKAIKSNALFGIYKSSQDISDNRSEKKTTSTPENTGTRLPKLGTCLYRLLDKTKLLTINETPTPLNDQYETLKAYAKQINIAEGIPLSDYFWTHPAPVGYAGVTLFNSINRWPADTLPHGFMLVIAQQLTENKIFCAYGDKKYELTLTGKIKKSSGRLGSESAPYLTLLTIAKDPREKLFKPMDAFAVPVYAHHLLMPVESSYERTVLHKLIQLMFSLKKHGVPVKITKPMFDIDINPEESCRPDFLLETPHKKIVIEVMGSNEDEYVERKLRTHGIMKKLGELIEIDAYTADLTNQWEPYLERLAKQIYFYLLKNN